MGRRTLVLVIAVALAAISGFAIYTYLSNVEDDIRAEVRDGLMTVFGFGRKGIEKYLDSVPQRFSIGFLETADYANIKTIPDSAVDIPGWRVQLAGGARGSGQAHWGFLPDPAVHP